MNALHDPRLILRATLTRINSVQLTLVDPDFSLDSLPPLRKEDRITYELLPVAKHPALLEQLKQRDAYAEIQALHTTLDSTLNRSYYALTLDPHSFLDETNIERLNNAMNPNERRALANQLLTLAELILED